MAQAFVREAASAPSQIRPDAAMMIATAEAQSAIVSGSLVHRMA